MGELGVRVKEQQRGKRGSGRRKGLRLVLYREARYADPKMTNIQKQADSPLPLIFLSAPNLYKQNLENNYAGRVCYVQATEVREKGTGRRAICRTCSV
jgi:hypothetical protein